MNLPVIYVLYVEYTFFEPTFIQSPLGSVPFEYAEIFSIQGF